MYVHQAELKASAYKVDDFPGGERPEIAFLGRSNVGKSSLLNKLAGRKNLARTSSTPGKTQGIYFYLINDNFFFVDLPGYGYARVSKQERAHWAPIIEEYLGARSNLYGCLHLIDCRHEPTDDDHLMAQWLRMHSIQRITVVTKVDKLSRGALLRQLTVIRNKLDLFEEEPVLPFSTATGAGREVLWRAIQALLPHGKR
ncbi:MAG: ribosome biogenesis GTP-binding protein YihA/YsxC [Bacillota bacterium]|nr:ribosome biogenesis GTP-binding protein YihA/YsxC [Bacillota bacterium]